MAFTKIELRCLEVNLQFENDGHLVASLVDLVELHDAGTGGRSHQDGHLVQDVRALVLQATTLADALGCVRYTALFVRAATHCCELAPATSKLSVRKETIQRCRNFLRWQSKSYIKKQMKQI